MQAALERGGFDVILSDVRMPDVDGLGVLRAVKQLSPETVVIMMTAFGSIETAIETIKEGAYDYISKPFSPRELVARVKVVLRRGPLRDQSGGGERVVRGALAIDLGRHEARLADQLLNLTPTEMRLLHFLASHPGRVFPRAHLLSRVIGEDAIVTDRNIDVHVRSLRQKLGEHADFIETVRGVGYRFTDAAK